MNEVGESLQCNSAFELGVFGFTNNTHPSSAELLEDSVVGNNSVDHGEPR